MTIHRKARLTRPRFWCGLGVVAAAILSVSVLAGQTTVLAQQHEPPLQFLLQVEGKSVPVLLDRPFEVEIGEKKIKMTLTVMPYRVFDAIGVRFRYQRHYAFEVKPDDSPQWWLSGNDNKIMLMKIDKQVDPALMVDTFLESMPKIFPEGVNTSDPSEVSMLLHDRLVRGKRFIVRFGGLSQRQEVFAFSHRGATYLLAFQGNVRENGRVADESVRARRMLEESFEFRD